MKIKIEVLALIVAGTWPLAAVAAVASQSDRQAVVAKVPEKAAPPRWDLAALGHPPKTYPAPEIAAPGVRSLFYDGPAFQGRSTRVFAFYAAPKTGPSQKLPAMVLVHGGGGTAFDRWARLWCDRGYAAIAMDLCGCLPLRVDPKDPKCRKWKRHEQGGPPGWGGFEAIDQPPQDQWTYHAVADVILAHSLLRSLAEVDPQRVGVTGISWGGYLTCITAGVDHRFRFAVPVYGCGFLGDNSVWLPMLEKMTSAGRAHWLAWWDPSVYLRDARMPMLWVDGTNDFAYPMDSLQKSYRLAPGPRSLCLRVRMPHGHGAAGENPAEIQAFADSHLRGGVPLAKVTGQGRDRDRVWASFSCSCPVVRAELNFTRDAGAWQQRKWETLPAQLDASRRQASAQLPQGVKVYYLNLIDQRNLVVSSEHSSDVAEAGLNRQP
jgi:dienelactone hydrolase